MNKARPGLVIDVCAVVLFEEKPFEKPWTFLYLFSPNLKIFRRSFDSVLN